MSNYLTNRVKYFLCSKHKKGFGIHSPFLFNLITLIFNDKSDKVVYHKVDMIRKELLKSKKIINVTDFGAGSKILTSDKRKVSEITKFSSVKKKYGRLLYRLSAFYKPQTILELGTSVGISGAYLALGNHIAKVVTVEGCPEISHIAQETFTLLETKNVTLVNGTFEEVLPLTFFDLRILGIVFFDGNHTKEATLNYFKQCIPFTNNDSLFIFDDIHWSEGMEGAWEEIKKNKNVTLTVDLFQLGLVYFHKELSKQDFVIRF